MTARKKKKVSAAVAKLRHQMGVEIHQEFLRQKREAFKSTTQEQRRAFIGAMHQGSTIGAARAHAGISLDAAMEVLRRNTKVVKYEVITPAEEVQ